MITLNFNNTTWDAIPPVLRTLINFEWLQVLMKPIKYNWDVWTGYTFDTNFELYHNSQVLSFNDYINHHVPPVQLADSAYISDGQWINAYYLWMIGDGDEDYKIKYMDFEYEDIFDPTYIFFDTEYLTEQYDFVLNYYDSNITAEDPTYLERLMLWTDKMKIIGTSYKTVAH